MYHIWIEGVSERTYTDEELENIDPPPFEFEGKQYTFYEATQKQRQVEASLRKVKRELIAAKGRGDDEEYTVKAVRYRRLNEEYEAFSKAAGLRPQRERGNIAEFGPKEAREASKAAKAFDNRTAESQRIIEKTVVNQPENDIMRLPDIQIGRSVGAKAANYDIVLPNSEIVHLTEGTKVTEVQVIAGKGRNRKIDVVHILIERYPGTKESEWQKAKGIGYVDYRGESYKAALHWYQEPTIGRVEWKVKPDAAGNWFFDED